MKRKSIKFRTVPGLFELVTMCLEECGAQKQSTIAELIRRDVVEVQMALISLWDKGVVKRLDDKADTLWGMLAVGSGKKPAPAALEIAIPTPTPTQQPIAHTKMQANHNEFLSYLDQSIPEMEAYANAIASTPAKQPEKKQETTIPDTKRKDLDAKLERRRQERKRGI